MLLPGMSPKVIVQPVLIGKIYSPTEGLGISVDIGSMEPGIGLDPVVFTIGLVRDPVVQYTNGNSQLEERNAYYWANFSTIDDVVRFFSH